MNNQNPFGIAYKDLIKKDGMHKNYYIRILCIQKQSVKKTSKSQENAKEEKNIYKVYIIIKSYQIKDIKIYLIIYKQTIDLLEIKMNIYNVNLLRKLYFNQNIYIKINEIDKN